MYKCDICSAEMADKESGTFFDQNRVSTSPGYWDYLINGKSPLSEDSMGMYVQMCSFSKSGFVVCDECKEMLNNDFTNFEKLGLEKYIVSIPSGEVDAGSAVIVAGTIYKLNHGKWPSTLPPEPVAAEGTTSSDQLVATDGEVTSQEEVYVQDPRYASVGGWLLLLCLGLTIFSPLLTLFNLVSTYTQTESLYSQYPGLQTIFLIDLGLSCLLMFLSIRAGIALWSIKPGAVQTAKYYLLILLGYSFIAAFLPFMAGLPSSANDAMIPEVVKGCVRSLLYFGIWYTYLNVSKRVNATYID